MKYKSKAGYSLDYKKKEMGFFIVGVIVVSLATLLFPKPFEYYLSGGVLLIGTIFVLASIIVMKLTGVVTEVDGDLISIYKTNSSFVEASSNEAVFNFYVGTVQAKCQINKTNILKIRKVIDLTELNEIKKKTKVYKTGSVRIGGNHPHHIGGIGGPAFAAGAKVLAMSFTDISVCEFITDFSNIVEISVRRLKVIKNAQANESKTEIINNAKILVSVKNPGEFIKMLS